MKHDNYREDPTVIWVQSDKKEKGAGSHDDPYGTINHALDRVKPGMTIMLKGGVYYGDVSLQISGEINQPIRICAEPDADVRIMESCWYFYDVSDLIVEHLTFSGSAAASMSIVGASLRNSFRNLRFVNCSLKQDGACTLFFGGAGSTCNIIENCHFEQSHSTTNAKFPIGIMVTEGDINKKEMLNTDHIFRKNSFKNYGCGIVLGSRGTEYNQFGHIAERNTINGCSHDGIRTRCSDTIIRSNDIRDCDHAAISIASGFGSIVENNRIHSGHRGIHVSGSGHTISNNCISYSKKNAIEIIHQHTLDQYENEWDGNNGSCNFFELNTLISDDHDDSSKITLMSISNLTINVVRKNIFSGNTTPYSFSFKDSKSEGLTVIENNIVTDKTAESIGCRYENVDFKNTNELDFSTTSEFGAHGWVCDGNLDKRDQGDDEQRPNVDYEEPSEPDDVDELIHEVDREELLRQTMFYNGDIPPVDL